MRQRYIDINDRHLVSPNTYIGWAQYCSRHEAVEEFTKLTKKSRSSTTSLGDLRMKFKDKTKGIKSYL